MAEPLPNIFIALPAPVRNGWTRNLTTTGREVSMAFRFALYTVIVSLLNVNLVSAQQVSSYFEINGQNRKLTISQCADLQVTAATNVTFIVKNVVTWELYRDNLLIFEKSTRHRGVFVAVDQVAV